jgi:hypothetical protein
MRFEGSRMSCMEASLRPIAIIRRAGVRVDSPLHGGGEREAGSGRTSASGEAEALELIVRGVVN